MWEPYDGQHIVYACNVLAEEAFAIGDIIEEERNNIFRRSNAIPVVYNNPKMYIEMSKRQNDFYTPNQKETHALDIDQASSIKGMSMADLNLKRSKMFRDVGICLFVWLLC